MYEFLHRKRCYVLRCREQGEIIQSRLLVHFIVFHFLFSFFPCHNCQLQTILSFLFYWPNYSITHFSFFLLFYRITMTTFDKSRNGKCRHSAHHKTATAASTIQVPMNHINSSMNYSRVLVMEESLQPHRRFARVLWSPVTVAAKIQSPL